MQEHGMSAIELKDLMIHVERIVRPLHATERRKLQMRRELLGHLQAALEEERAGGAEEGLAWAAAKRRLGEPVQLTRDLQNAVPAVERVMWWRKAGAPMLPRRESGRNLQLGILRMRFWQGMAYMFVAQVFIFGGIAAVTYRMGIQNLNTLMWAFADRTWRLKLGLLITVALVGALVHGGLSIAEASAARQTRRVMRLGLRGAASIVVWQLAMACLLTGAGTLGLNLLAGTAAALSMTAGMAWLGRFLRPGMRDLGEWMTLEV
jgi:hypothetical protein